MAAEDLVSTSFPEIKEESKPITDTRAMLGFADSLWDILRGGESISESILLEATRHYPYLQSEEGAKVARCLQSPSECYPEYPQGTEETAFDISLVPDNILMDMFSYAIGRLPQELLYNDARIVFDTSYDARSVNIRQKPEKRSRGYFLSPIGDSAIDLWMEVRTRTDFYEIISCLGIVAAVRSRINNLNIELEGWEDSQEEYSNQRSDVIATQKSSHLEQYRALIAGRLETICSRIQSTDQSGRNIAATFPLHGFSLIQAFGRVPLSDKIPHARHHSKREKQRCPYAVELAQMAVDLIHPADRLLPHFMFFSNSFTYAQTMAGALLQQPIDLPSSSAETVYDLLSYVVDLTRMSPEEAIPFRIRNLITLTSKYEETDEEGKKVLDPTYKKMSLSSQMVTALLDEESVEFVIDFCKKNYPSVGSIKEADPIDKMRVKGVNDIIRYITDFRANVNSERFMRNIGMRVLVDERVSPTCDAVHYIDFSQVRYHILNRLHPLLRESLEELSNGSVRFIVLPYALGELSSHLIREFSGSKQVARFNVKGIVEMGKVGLLSPSTRSVRVGKSVDTVCAGMMGNGQDGIKSVHPQPHYDNRPRVFMLQAPTVLWQTLGDVLEAQRKLEAINSSGLGPYSGQHSGSLHALCVGMEHYSLIKAAAEGGAAFISGDYISDAVDLQEDRIGRGGLGILGTPGYLESYISILQRVCQIVRDVNLERTKFNRKIEHSFGRSGDRKSSFGDLILRVLKGMSTPKQIRSENDGLCPIKIRYDKLYPIQEKYRPKSRK